MKACLLSIQDTPEVLWNCFRLGNLMLENMDDVTIFLNGPSVTYGKKDTTQFKINELAKVFVLSEGHLLA